MFLPFDGTHGDFAAFVHVETIGLSGIHFGVGSAVAVERTLADLRVDTTGDEESDADVVVFQFQRLIKPEQGMFRSAIRRAQRKAEKP